MRRSTKLLWLIPMLCVGASMACELKLDGTAFLLAARDKGNSVGKDDGCDDVKMETNTFYALPIRACTLVFRFGDWLKKDFHFVEMSGGGKFDITTSDSTVSVVIAKAEGFKLTQVVVSRDGNDCKNLDASSIVRSPRTAAAGADKPDAPPANAASSPGSHPPR